MEILTQVHGTTMSLQAKGLKLQEMVMSTKDNLNMDSSMEKGHTNGLMAQSMKGIGSKARFKALAAINRVMVALMLGSGKIT